MVEQVHRHTHESMISVEEARERILRCFHALDAEFKPVLDAEGQTLAEDIVGPFDIPPLDNSAMDGYAVVSGDVRAASDVEPATLRVIGSVAAGQLPQSRVTHGAAVRIMTGAPIPEGADAVVPFEDTDETERRASGLPLSQIAVRSSVPPSANVRPAGQDVRAGERVLERGSILRAAEIGVLARNSAAPRSKSSGGPSQPSLPRATNSSKRAEICLPGRIYDVNSYSLAVAVRRAGGVPKMLGIARDNVQDLNAKLEEGFASDILLTSAGVSKGDYDVVKNVLAHRGQIELWSVRMRPAKPLAFGMLDRPGRDPVPHLGLPGNPVSALVGFEQLGRPAILKMMGKTKLARPTVQAILEEPIHNYDGRRVYARAVVTRRNGAYYARLTGHQSSNILTSMARANGLAICPEDVAIKQAGESVKVQMIDWPEDVF